MDLVKSDMHLFQPFHLERLVLYFSRSALCVESVKSFQHNPSLQVRLPVGVL